MSSDPYRLDRRAVPTHYDLRVRPDVRDGSFSGSVSIDVEITEVTGEVVLNAADLDVTSANVTNPDGTVLDLAVQAEPGLERIVLRCPTDLHPGEHRITLTFNGGLDGRLRGVYRSTTTGPDGEALDLVVTQFEATDARRAFPCFDEPSFKATFDITLVVPSDHMAISNAAETSRRPASDDDGFDEVRFGRTMKMSTYLVAFVVGPLEVTETVHSAGGVPVRIVHPPGKAHLARYGLDVATFCLDWFADYYGIPYPGDKLDLVAIPDFAFGAMENLGCVTFREVLLLVDPDEATQPELQNVTDVIAHELAHMWFGDLVTMDWWEGIWLNEAFATFMEMAATDAYRPDWERWTGFGVARTAAFDVDALAGTRPIEYPVVSPDDAEGMFDILTYEKGAAVLRMLEQWLGPDGFRAGIRRYLAEHAYGNTRTSDLWDALETATGAPVRRIAEAWILQGGFPLVSVDLVDEGSTLRLAQQPFAYAGDPTETADAPEPDTRVWPVPVILTLTGGGATTLERELVEPDGIDVSLVEPLTAVVANTEGTGFYRVAYAPDLVDALVARAATDLSPIERYGLVDDAWAAVLADRATVVDALVLVERLASTETDLAVWQRLSSVLDAVDRLVEPPQLGAWQSFVGGIVGPAAERVAEALSAHPDDRLRQVRGLLFAALGNLAADPATIAAARDLVDRTSSDVDPAMAAAAISVVAANGDADDYDRFSRSATEASTPQDELRYLTALADFPHDDLVDRVVTSCIDGTVRTQNAPYLLRRAMANRHAGVRAWDAVERHWARINDHFPSNSIARMLEGVRYLDAPAVAARVDAFFERNEVPQGDRILAQHLERLGVAVALRRRSATSLAAFLGRR